MKIVWTKMTRLKYVVVHDFFNKKLWILLRSQVALFYSTNCRKLIRREINPTLGFFENLNAGEGGGGDGVLLYQ